MRKFYSVLLICVGAFALGGCTNPEILTMQPATSNEGWRGNVFYRDGTISAEEFATGAHGSAVDVWRFYDGYGRLYREEIDARGDGTRNLRRDFNKDGVLIAERIDHDGDGIYDEVNEYNPKRVGRENSSPTVADRTPNRENSRENRREKVTPVFESQPVADPLAIAPIENREAYVDENSASFATTNVSVGSGYSESPESNSAAMVVSAPPSAPIISPARDHENWIRPIKLPAPSFGDSTNAATRVVPGPVFQHPSDNLED